MDNEVKQFIKKHNLINQLYQVNTFLPGLFGESWGASFSVQTNPECDCGAGDTLVLDITSDLPHKDFLTARKELFKRLRENGCKNLCTHLAVLRQ